MLHVHILNAWLLNISFLYFVSYVILYICWRVNFSIVLDILYISLRRYSDQFLFEPCIFKCLLLNRLSSRLVLDQRCNKMSIDRDIWLIMRFIYYYFFVSDALLDRNLVILLIISLMRMSWCFYIVILIRLKILLGGIHH